ncbi:MAG: Gfo/Idh/MocA family oxidoreductase [Nocardioidaceae bacterium]
MRIGVAGYGTGGRHFHTPFIEAAEGVTLGGVVTRSPERARAVSQAWPGVPTYASLGDLLAAGVDAVSITTPPTTRGELVLEAITAGVHVIADKPLAPTADAARELERAAAEADVMLSVFHNRRWDADICTLASVVEGGRLGTLWRVFSGFDLDDQATLEAGPGGGLLRDIGSHVVDQMLCLLGPVRSVNAHLDWVDLEDGRTESGFTIDLQQHTSGVRSYLESSKLNHLAARELRAYGAEESCRASGTDVQASATRRGSATRGGPRRVGLRHARELGRVGHLRRGGERSLATDSLPGPLHAVCRSIPRRGRTARAGRRGRPDAAGAGRRAGHRAAGAEHRRRVNGLAPPAALRLLR